MSDAETAAAEIDAAPPPPQWPIVVKLADPVKWGDQMIDTLEFKRGTLAVLKGLKIVPNEVPFDTLITIAARLSAQPPKVIEWLSPDDGQEVMSIALDFYGKCLSGMKQ